MAKRVDISSQLPGTTNKLFTTMQLCISITVVQNTVLQKQKQILSATSNTFVGAVSCQTIENRISNTMCEKGYVLRYHKKQETDVLLLVPPG